MKINKIISAAAAIAVSLSMLPVFTIFAADKAKKDLLVLGDSISTGYGVTGYVANSYGDYVADFYGYNLTNLAKNGFTATELLDSVKNNAEVRASVSNADVIMVSIGGNDLMHAADNALGGNIFQVAKELQNKTLAQVASDVTKISKALDAEVTVGKDVFPKLNAELNKLNSNATVIFQTVYNPLVISQAEFDALTKDNPNYKSGYNVFRGVFNDNIKNYNSTIRALSGVKILDTFKAFTTDKDDALGYAGVYTNILAPKNDDKDFHPNRLGHMIIAMEAMKILGVKKSNTSLLYRAYAEFNFSDLAAIPDKGQTLFAASVQVTKGDFNGDGTTDAVDASLALVCYVAIQAGGKVPAVACVNDTDANGVIDAIDASAVLAHFADVQTGGKGTL